MNCLFLQCTKILLIIVSAWHYYRTMVDPGLQKPWKAQLVEKEEENHYNKPVSSMFLYSVADSPEDKLFFFFSVDSIPDIPSALASVHPTPINLWRHHIIFCVSGLGQWLENCHSGVTCSSLAHWMFSKGQRRSTLIKWRTIYLAI